MIPASDSEPSGDGDALEALEIELLLAALVHRHGYDFRGYTRSSLRRRIRRVMSAEGVTNASALQERVLRDSGALARLVSGIAVHVTSFFRDPQQLDALRNSVLPLLRTWPFIRVWVAGCATGEEAISVAILLAEAGLLNRTWVYATDLAPAVVEEARRGAYPVSHIIGAEERYRQSGGTSSLTDYFHIEGNVALVKDTLQRSLVIAQHDLVSDGSFNEFHLVLCRNVMIYFDPLLRERVYRLLHESLVRFGVLALGPGEGLEHTIRAGKYTPLDAGARLFRKTG